MSNSICSLWRCSDLAEEHDAIAIDDAELAVFAAAERLQPQRVGLGDVARGVDLVVQHDERALVARRRIGRHAHALEQVGGAFVAERARVAHRADDDHRPRIADGQVQEERGFFERVGAARDDDAGELLVGGEDFVDALREAEPLRERQLAAGDVGELLVRQPREALDAGHRLGQLFGREPAAVAVGNRAAGRHEVHAGQRPLRALRGEGG